MFSIFHKQMEVDFVSVSLQRSKFGLQEDERSRQEPDGAPTGLRKVRVDLVLHVEQHMEELCNRGRSSCIVCVCVC